MSKQPQGPVAEEVAKQIATTVADRKKDVTIPASKRAEQTVKNDARHITPGRTGSTTQLMVSTRRGDSRTGQRISLSRRADLNPSRRLSFGVDDGAGTASAPLARLKCKKSG